VGERIHVGFERTGKYLYCRLTGKQAGCHKLPKVLSSLKRSLSQLFDRSSGLSFNRGKLMGGSKR
jgi:hypothetical protein